jgi:DNA polymerase-3 subunit delta
MAQTPPVVYILHGDDEFAIAQAIAEFENMLGDEATAAMNFSQLDGRYVSQDELLSAAGAMPFLAKRRLVVLRHPLARLRSKAERESFLESLERIPESTACVLVHDRPLLSEKERRNHKRHWLEKWADQRPQRVFLREYSLPRGAAMGRWIQGQAKTYGGQISSSGASLLASLVGEDTRLADQEIQKLLAYVDFTRPVEPEDVENLTADTVPGDIFVMVDALGNQNGRQALGMLQRLLEEQDPFSIFGMVVRQFRLLLLTREILDEGGSTAEIARQLKLHSYVAGKMSAQARSFTITTLETVFRQLLDIDEAMKTGKIEAELALDTLVAAFTG